MDTISTTNSEFSTSEYNQFIERLPMKTCRLLSDKRTRYIIARLKLNMYSGTESPLNLSNFLRNFKNLKEISIESKQETDKEKDIVTRLPLLMRLDEHTIINPKLIRLKLTDVEFTDFNISGFTNIKFLEINKCTIRNEKTILLPNSLEFLDICIQSLSSHPPSSPKNAENLEETAVDSDNYFLQVHKLPTSLKFFKLHGDLNLSTVIYHLVNNCSKFSKNFKKLQLESSIPPFNDIDSKLKFEDLKDDLKTIMDSNLSILTVLHEDVDVGTDIGELDHEFLLNDIHGYNRQHGLMDKEQQQQQQKKQVSLSQKSHQPNPRSAIEQIATGVLPTTPCQSKKKTNSTTNRNNTENNNDNDIPKLSEEEQLRELYERHFMTSNGQTMPKPTAMNKKHDTSYSTGRQAILNTDDSFRESVNQAVAKDAAANGPSPELSDCQCDDPNHNGEFDVSQLPMLLPNFENLNTEDMKDLLDKLKMFIDEK